MGPSQLRRKDGSRLTRGRREDGFHKVYPEPPPGPFPKGPVGVAMPHLSGTAFPAHTGGPGPLDGLLHDSVQRWGEALMTPYKILDQVFKKQGGEGHLGGPVG